eukprot:365564-Chlamydomonas_euryale.AAC.4
MAGCWGWSLLPGLPEATLLALDHTKEEWGGRRGWRGGAGDVPAPRSTRRNVWRRAGRGAAAQLASVATLPPAARKCGCGRAHNIATTSLFPAGCRCSSRDSLLTRTRNPRPACVPQHRVLPANANPTRECDISCRRQLWRPLSSSPPPPPPSVPLSPRP